MFTLNKTLILLFSLVFVGCSSDYKITQKVEKTEPGVEIPEIEVDPVSHSFGALSAGTETQNTIITIKNLGNGNLNIDNIYLHSGSSNFSLTSIPSGEIEPNSEKYIIVSYSPGTYETNSDTISILSNDEDEPNVLVTLDGSGDAPIITVTHDYYDFGTVYLGCDDTLEIEVGNIGNSNLIISDLEYFSSIPDDFSMQEYEPSHGILPITVAPGATIDLHVDYVPLDSLDDSAYIEITSNDPASPTAWADHDALGDYEAWVLDSFTQDGDATVDILFVVDNSGSMSSNQTNLKNNFDDFMAVFVSAGVDYQVAIITTDQSDFVGDVITPATPDPVTEFGNQIDLVGYSGYAIEKGLWFAYESTISGDASSTSSTGFLREPARLVVVYVSDEPDASTSLTYSGGSTTMTPSDYSASLLSLKSSPSLVVAHAVAGDHPSGCSGNGHAQFGDGYYDVVNDLGGTFMSICAEDWSVTMDTLARESMAELSFSLTGDPVEDTISVTVDSYTSTDWTYDSTLNSVVFTTAPSNGSTIDITYAIWAECDSAK